MAQVIPQGAIWEPFCQPVTGQRKLGVPPGGPWNPLFSSLLDQLERPLTAGTLVAIDRGPCAQIASELQTAWILFGSPGFLVTDQGQSDLPCFWAGRGSAEVVSYEGGRICLAAWPSLAPPLLGMIFDLDSGNPDVVRCLSLPGMERILDGSTWEVSPRSSNVGMRLIGQAPELGSLDASRPSSPGVVQAAGKGELLIHGPDGPTTGGYPQVGSVIRADRGRLSEVPLGSIVTLRLASVEEAAEAWREESARILKAAKTIQNLKRLGLV